MDFNKFNLNENNPFMIPSLPFSNNSFEMPANSFPTQMLDPSQLMAGFNGLPQAPPVSDHSSLEITNTDEWKWHIKSNNKLKNGVMARYYVCAMRSCSARKNIKIAPDNTIIDIKYKGEHNHSPNAVSTPIPTPNSAPILTEKAPKWLPAPDFWENFGDFSHYLQLVSVWPHIQLIIASPGGLSMLGSHGKNAALVPIYSSREADSIEISCLMIPVPECQGFVESAIPVAFIVTNFLIEPDADIKNRFKILRNLIELSQNRWNPKNIVTSIDSSWFLALKMAFSVKYPEKLGRLKTNLIVNNVEFDTEVTSTLSLIKKSMKISELSLLNAETEKIYFSENLQIFEEKVENLKRRLDPENLLSLKKLFSNKLISPQDYLYFNQKDKKSLKKLDFSVNLFFTEIFPLISQILQNSENLNFLITQLINLLKKCEENSSVTFSRLRRAENFIESPEISEEEDEVHRTTQRVRELDSVSSGTAMQFPEFLVAQKERK